VAFKRILYWLCVLAVAMPMVARLGPSPTDPAFDVTRILVVGDSQCGIPTAPLDSFCRSPTWRPLLLVTSNDAALRLLDILALAWLAIAAWWAMPGGRLGLRASAAGPTVALSCGLVVVCVLQAASWYQVPGSVLPAMELHMLVSQISRGHLSNVDLRSILVALWFWIVFGSALFGVIGRSIDRAPRPHLVGVLHVGARAKAAGALLFMAVMVAAFGVAALVGGQVYSDFWYPLGDELALLALALGFATTAVALGRSASWARGAGVVLAVLALGAGPMCAFVGVFVLWQLCSRGKPD
jgi:hypothetical protein